MAAASSVKVKRQTLLSAAMVISIASMACGQGCIPQLGQLNLDAAVVAATSAPTGKQHGITWDPFLPGFQCKTAAAALEDFRAACRDFNSVRLYDLSPNDGCTAAVDAVVAESGRIGCSLHLGLRVRGNDRDQDQLNRLRDFLDPSLYPDANIRVVAVGNEVILDGVPLLSLGIVLRQARAIINQAYPQGGRRLAQALTCADDCDCPADQFCASNSFCNVATPANPRQCSESPTPPGPSPPAPTPPGQGCTSQCCSDCDCPSDQFCAPNGFCNVATPSSPRQCPPDGTTPPPSPPTPGPPPSACDSQCCSDCDCPPDQFCAANGFCNVVTPSRPRQCSPGGNPPPPGASPPPTQPPSVCDSQCCSDCDCPSDQFCAPNGFCNVVTPSRPRQCNGGGGGGGGGGRTAPVLIVVEELFAACRSWGSLSQELASAQAMVSFNIYTGISTDYTSFSGAGEAMAQAAIDTFETALWARSTFTNGMLFEISECGWGYQGSFGGFGGSNNIASPANHAAYIASMAKIARLNPGISAYLHHYNDMVWKGSSDFSAIAIFAGLYHDSTDTFRYCDTLPLPSC